MSKAKVFVDKFFADGAIFEGAPSKLAFAAALTMIGATMLAPPSTGAEPGGASVRGSDFSYSAFVADLQARLDHDLGFGRIVVLDRAASDHSQADRLQAIGVQGLAIDAAQRSETPSIRVVGSNIGAVCIVAGPAPSLTAEATFALKGGDVAQLGDITNLDVQKWGTYAQVGQCFGFNSPRQGAVFAAFMTHLDDSVSSDLLPMMIAYNELNEWTGIASPTNDYVSTSLRRAAQVLGNDLFLGELDDASIQDVADFAGKTYTNESSWRADTFKTALQESNVVAGPNTISVGFDTEWLDRARIVPEVEQVRDLRDYLLDDPMTRVLPAQLVEDETATKLFTRLLAEQGDSTAIQLAANFNYDISNPATRVIKHPPTVETQASAFAVEEDETELYSPPKM